MKKLAPLVPLSLLLVVILCSSLQPINCSSPSSSPSPSSPSDTSDLSLGPLLYKTYWEDTTGFHKMMTPIGSGSYPNHLLMHVEYADHPHPSGIGSLGVVLYPHRDSEVHTSEEKAPFKVKHFYYLVEDFFDHLDDEPSIDKVWEDFFKGFHERLGHHLQQHEQLHGWWPPSSHIAGLLVRSVEDAKRIVKWAEKADVHLTIANEKFVAGYFLIEPQHH